MNFFKKLFGLSEQTNFSKSENKSNRDIEDEFSKAIQILKKYKRTAYIPQTVASTNTFSTESKIGGYPYLRNEQDWPICPNCSKNMQLFLQLDLSTLPEKKETGLIQMFYCTSEEPQCEDDLETWSPFSTGVVCRKIEVAGESAAIVPNLGEVYPEKSVASWKAKDDYPHFEEYQNLGIVLKLEDDIYELMEQREIGLPILGDKLVGWPYWVQSEEYAADRITGNSMQLLFQFDSEDNLPILFGDSGIGHLMQSPDNNEELAFGWACY